MANKTTLLRPFIETSWVHDIDESETPQYYGRMDLDGNWVIIRKTATTIRFAGYKNNTSYATGQGGYGAAWTDRASLTYGYINQAI